MRLIDADVLIEQQFKNDISYNAFCSLVKRQKTINAQTVRHGRWEIYQLAELGQAWTVQCSACHAIGFHGKTPYCCECGARMDGDQNETD